MVSSEGDSFSSCIKLVKRSPNAFAICTWPEVNIYYFLPGAKITFSSLPLSLHCWIFPSFFLTTSHGREINTLVRHLGRSETWMVGTMERAIGSNDALAIKCFMWRKEECTLRNTRHPNKTYHQPARAAAIFLFRILFSKACYAIKREKRERSDFF